MLLWVGLGNPDASAQSQRHNVGFAAIDAIATAHDFGPWKPRFRGLAAEGQIGPTRILALKPLTYMNASGDSVQPTAAFYKIPPEQITAFHDELDLAPGRVRVKHGGGSAGHNGLRSLHQSLASPDFWRVRIGIGHPGDKARVLAHVLGNFAKPDREWLAPLLEAIATSATLLAQFQPEDFMTRVAYLTQEHT